MIVPEDNASILRMTGLNEVPDDIAREYAIRARMYHSDGGSGAMGPLALIPLLRSLAYDPPSVKEQPVKVDWTQYPQDGSLRVEARFFGSWMLGSFLGFVEYGTLAIRLDETLEVKECRPDMVRIAANQDPPPSPLTDNLSHFDNEETVDQGVLDENEPDTEVDTAGDAQDGLVQVGDDIKECKILAIAPDNTTATVHVLDEGEPRIVPRSDVTIGE